MTRTANEDYRQSIIAIVFQNYLSALKMEAIFAKTIGRLNRYGTRPNRLVSRGYKIKTCTECAEPEAETGEKEKMCIRDSYNIDNSEH